MKTLKIDNSKIITKNFRGISYIHNAYEYMPDDWDRNLTEELIDFEIETLKKMGVTMVRSFYGGSLTWDDEKCEHNFESDFAMAFYKACKRLGEAGIEVGIAPGWHMEGFWQGVPDEQRKRYSVNLDHHGGFVKGDLEATAKNFEKFIEDSVKAFERHGVTNITHIFCFTECNNSLIDYPKIIKPKGWYYERREYDRLYPAFDCLLSAVDQGLKNAGKRDQYKIVAPCDNWYGDSEYAPDNPHSLLVKYCAEHLADKVDIIGSHNGYIRSVSYSDKREFYELPEARNTNPRDVAKSLGKEYFVDETNAALSSITSAIQNLQTYDNPLRGVAFGAMVNKFMNMGGVHNMYIWALYSQQWPNIRWGNGLSEFIDGMHIVGYLHNLKLTKIPTYPWYAIALLTRYLQKGDVFLGDDNGNTYVSAMEREDGETTIVLTNYEDDETEIELDFAKSLEGKTFYKYVYDTRSIIPDEKMEMIKCSDVKEGVNDKLSDKVLGLSVTVYTTEKPEA